MKVVNNYNIKDLREKLDRCKNPYIFKVNNKLVKIGFSDNNRTADDALTCVLKNLYRWFFY